MSSTSQVIYQGQLHSIATHTASGIAIETDAPVDNNGKGACFSPTDLAATSLASCMITVMGIAAEKRGIPFSNVSADVKKVMASSPRRIAEIHVNLTVRNHSWTIKEKEVLEKIGRTCPVALSLHPDVKQEINFEYIDDVD